MNTSNEFVDDLAENKAEWLESLAYVQKEFGDEGVKEIVIALQNQLLNHGGEYNFALNTPYLNTIPVQEQAAYPGDIKLEKRIEDIMRWNAMAMVVKGSDSGDALGGHIASFASAATMMEVGFNHVFRNRSENYGGDMVLLQGTTAPGTYSRAFLEGRLSEEQLLNYRRELSEGGLCSYSHPRSMPDFWEVPNGSMGLGIPTAIYQARFVKYLEARGLKARNGGKVWCFVGDGESDEPEVLGMLNIAAREKLDNIIMIFNCNLQRLDGPVRGNGKIIQELERSFIGASWNVLKVIWGSGWDELLAQDHTGALRRRMEECVDGDYQQLSTLPLAERRKEWINGDKELEKLFSHLSDQDFDDLQRGGHDRKKVFSAYQKAQQTVGKPSVIFIKTVKGDAMGTIAQGSNTAHQKKVLSEADREFLAKAYNIPLSNEEVHRADFYLPKEDSDEVKYLHKHREALGGFMPERKVSCEKIDVNTINAFTDFTKGTGERAMSSTTIMVRVLSKLLKDKSIGKYIVPIVPDEARTFGMDSLFKSVGIYSPQGQNYTPVDAKTLMPYRETKDGQLLQEGICEIGAMGSFLAAGTSYAVHGLPMIPFYIFYSIFGPQRVADMMWHCADMMCRGFMLGGTAGRTTLNGEGIQHQDGHSHIMGSAFPNLICYDPAFGYEIEVIVREGIRRMYGEGENIFYYLTLYNENYPMPQMPNNEDIEEGILNGMYCFKRSNSKGEIVNLMASGCIMQQALNAAEMLENLGYAVNIWSVTSFTELYRNGQATQRENRLRPTTERKLSYLEKILANEDGVFIAVTDYMQSLAESITRWMPTAYSVLGTEGFGLSESRSQLRDFFEVSPKYIVQAALALLFQQSKIDESKLNQQMTDLDIEADKQAPMDR